MEPERWQQIETIFQAALECDPTSRAVFLDSACLADDELRAEVESLLSAHAQAGSFIQAPALELAAQMTAPQVGAAVGHTVGPYQITQWLGAGGMGEVYLAFDPRLERQVALKFLPDYLVNDKQRVQRFKQEARAASALSHPNVATIYEIGESESQTYIAMEYVAGQTLNEHVNGQPLPLDEILEIALQVADALDEAHARGVTHRDIKSLNLMVTERGRVKVLDFGLAKMSRADALEPLNVVDENTVTTTSSVTPHSLATTTPGLVMGTAQYMSPEQALAQEVDQRTDIFSLGVVMYEMATGRLPFNGTSVPSVIERVLHATPEAITTLNPAVPRSLERVILRCLAKEPSERYQSARALWEDLQTLRREAGEPKASRRGNRRSLRWAWFGVVGLLVGVVALSGLFWVRSQGLLERKATQFSKPIPLTSYEGEEFAPAFSPDGKSVAFCWRDAATQETDVFVKAIGTETPTRLTSVIGYEHSPVWSPDGRSIAFIRNRRGAGNAGIFVVPATGGAERQLYPLQYNQMVDGLDWSADGKWMVFNKRNTETEPYSLWLLELNNLTVRRLTTPAAGLRGDHLAVFSPDGQSVAFARGNSESANLYRVTVSGGEPLHLNRGGARVWIMDIAWTPDGSDLIYAGSSNLWRVGANGGLPEQLDIPSNDVWALALSHSGKQLAYCDFQFDTNIWRGTLPSRAQAPVKLVASSRLEAAGNISPDGTRLIFTSVRSGPREVWRCQSDGSQPVQLTFSGNGASAANPRWSPDGREIVFSGPRGLYVIGADGGQLRRLTEGDWDDVLPYWAPNGASIYFGSNRSGSWEVWQVPISGGVARQVTSQGGYEAQVAPDGKFIYYTRRDSKQVYRLSVEGGTAQLVCELPNSGRQAFWAVAKEGIHFLHWDMPNAWLDFFDFATQRVTHTVALPGRPTEWDPGLSIAPDGRWFIYAQEDQRSTDLWLVKEVR